MKVKIIKDVYCGGKLILSVNDEVIVKKFHSRCLYRGGVGKKELLPLDCYEIIEDDLDETKRCDCGNELCSDDIYYYMSKCEDCR